MRFGIFWSTFTVGLTMVMGELTLKDFDQKIPQSWTNTKIEKSIDFTKSYVKEVLNIQAKNLEDVPVSKYFHPILKKEETDFALITGVTGEHGQFMLPIKVFNNSINSESPYNYLIVDFPAPIAAGSLVDFQLQFVHLNKLHPVPDKLELNGIQSVLFKTSKYPVTPYPIENYKLLVVGTNGKVTNLDAGKEQVNDLPELEEVSSDGRIVIFGHDEVEIPSWTIDYISLFFEKNKALAVAEYLQRDVWVSHGRKTITFEEIYETTNKVGELKGGFSRLEWMNSQYLYKPGPYVLAFDMSLPENFRDAYFTDLVGNVSTSKIVNDHLILKPRFPLFGGWKYNFTIGWTNDLDDFVTPIEGDDYIIRVPLINGHHDMSYNNVELSFYLPENAKFVDIKSAIPYESYDIDVAKSYLDFTGHTKVTVYYKNLIDEFSRSDVEVTYTFTTFDYYYKPLVLGSFLLVALFSYYLIKKIDIAIDNRSKKEI